MLMIIRSLGLLFIVMLPWSLYCFERMRSQQAFRRNEALQFLYRSNYVGDGICAWQAFMRVIIFIVIVVVIEIILVFSYVNS